MTDFSTLTSSRAASRYQRSRLFRKMLFVLLPLLVISVTYMTITSQIDLDVLLSLMSSLTILIGGGFVALKYLDGSKVENYSIKSIEIGDEFKSEIISRIDEIAVRQETLLQDSHRHRSDLEGLFKTQNAVHLSTDQQEDIYRDLKAMFASNLNEAYFERLNENVAHEIAKEKRTRIDALTRDFNILKTRISKEIGELSRKANLNLVIGSMTAILGFIGLAYSVLQNTVGYNSFEQLAYHYLPRLSLVIFIEIFAFFFLKLYKSNLEDMKYFQNELTNVELKIICTLTSINFGNSGDITRIVAKLSKTERNFILKRGESTVELERSRLENIELKSILKTFGSSGNSKN